MRELIRYEPETGKMFWKERDPRFFADTGSAFLWNVDNAGSEIFEKTSADGYRKGSLFGNPIWGHRVAWAIVHGKWPEGHLDHANGQRGDNRIANLREATHRVNMRNRVLGSNNTSGYVGVQKTKNGTYCAKILKRHIGTFNTFEEAVEARKAAQSEAPAFTERHGLPKIGTAYLRKSRRAKKEYTVIKYA